jgi:hypothetical protein
MPLFDPVRVALEHAQTIDIGASLGLLLITAILTEPKHSYVLLGVVGSGREAIAADEMIVG